MWHGQQMCWAILGIYWDNGKENRNYYALWLDVEENKGRERERERGGGVRVCSHIKVCQIKLPEESFVLRPS